MSTLRKFHEGFAELFNTKVDSEGGEADDSLPDDNDFNTRFGWIYNAKQVADFENISLWEFWEKDVMSFLNHLLYLNNYNSHMSKINKNANTVRD